MNNRIQIEQHRGVAGGLWLVRWLFTLGYLQLLFWLGLLALVLRPYDVGRAFSVLRIM